MNDSAHATTFDDVHAESPFGPSWPKVMMWLFILSDALTFAAFLSAYGLLRRLSTEWPDPSGVFDIRLITIMTFALISSSAVMATAVGRAQSGSTRSVIPLVLLTVLGGLIFLGLQAYEWTHVIGQGATPWSNPWGAPAFGASFFLITGFHGAHVLSGVVVLLVTALGVKSGRYTAAGVETAGLYWHFVDIVWVFVFAFFYLL
jgi:cytochrome c oxidase subunit 3